MVYLDSIAQRPLASITETDRLIAAGVGEDDAYVTPADLGRNILHVTAAGVRTLYWPAADTAAAWWDLLVARLTAAGAADQLHLPPVIFQAGAGITTTADVDVASLRLYGPGSTIKRGADTPTPAGYESGVLNVGLTGGGFVCRGVTFDGDGTATGATGDRGDTVFSAATSTFIDCTFTDPLINVSCFSLEHYPAKTSRDWLTLVNCVFDGTGYAAWQVLHGRVRMLGGEINIPSDRNGTGSGQPAQRLFMVAAKAGTHPEAAYLDGVNCHIAAPDVEDDNMGYWNFDSDETADDVAGLHAAVDDTGSEQVIESGFTQPAQRAGLSNACPCRVTVTTSGTAGDIGAIACTVVGLDRNGLALSEVLPLTIADQAGTVHGSKFFASVDSWTIPAHDGTGASTSLGFETPRMRVASMRNMDITYELMNMGANAQYCKWERVDEILLDNVHVTHLQDTVSDCPWLRSAFTCQSMTLRNCTIPGLVAPLNGTLRNLTIENCTLGTAGNTGSGSFVGNAEKILHIEITRTTLLGANAYLIDNVDTGPWAEYDEEATVTLSDVQYRFSDQTSNFICANIPRLGFLAAERLRDLNMDSVVSRFDGVPLARSVTARLAATVLPGDRHRAYLGRRLDTDSVRADLHAGETDAASHPFAVDVIDSGLSAFTVAAKAGDVIWNDYGGVDDLTGPADSGVLAWRYSSAGKWWPVLLVEADPPAP